MLIKNFFKSNNYWAIDITKPFKISQYHDLESINHLGIQNFFAFSERGYVITFQNKENPEKRDLVFANAYYSDIIDNYHEKFLDWLKQQDPKYYYDLLMEKLLLFDLVDRYDLEIIKRFPNYMQRITEDTFQILEEYKISPELQNELRLYQHLLPVVLVNINGRLVYSLLPFSYEKKDNDMSLVRTRLYVGIGNSGIKMDKLTLDNKYRDDALHGFSVCLRYLTDPIPRPGYYCDKKAVFIRNARHLGFFPLPVFRALTGQFPCNIIPYPEKHSEFSMQYWLITSLPETDPIVQLSMFGIAENFREFVDSLLPDELIEKVKNSGRLDSEEEENLAMFLDLSSVILQPVTMPNREYSYQYLGFQDSSVNSLIMEFIYNLTQRELKTASMLPQAVVEMANLANVEEVPVDYNKTRRVFVPQTSHDLIRIISYKGKIYVVGKKEKTLWGATINGVDLAPIKEKVLSKYYKYQ